MARKGRKGKKRKSKGGTIPLEVLEKRARRLVLLVEKRGGTSPREA